MGSSFTRKQHSEYKWPVIPPAPKVIPNTLVLEAKEFQLIIHCVDKSPTNDVLELKIASDDSDLDDLVTNCFDDCGIDDIIDPVDDKKIFDYKTVGAWRYDTQLNKYRSRGKGRLAIYYNKKKRLARLIFKDESNDNKTRLLQWIDGRDHCKFVNIVDADNTSTLPTMDQVEFYGADYTMGNTNPMKAKWKLRFHDSVNQANAFCNLFNKNIDFRIDLHNICNGVIPIFDDYTVQEQAICVRRIRQLLSIDNPPINEVIQSGVVPCLIQFLKNNSYTLLQFEAAWALGNIAAGTTENTAVVIRNGAIPILVNLVKSSDHAVQEQAIWALGNIAGDSPECRNLVLDHNVMNNLLPICKNWQNSSNRSPLSLLKTVSWALSNFCRGKPQPHMKYIANIVECLYLYLINVEEDEIYTNFGWAFYYLTSEIKDDHPLVKNMHDSGITDILISLLDHDEYAVRKPSMRSIGNIATGSDHDTEFCIQHGVLIKLSSLLSDNSPVPEKQEICWIMSNITAGNNKQIEAVIKAKIFPLLIDILKRDKYDHYDVAKEALWAISNAIRGGTDNQIKFLVNLTIIPVICSFIPIIQRSNTLLLVTLECLENILQIGKNCVSTNVCGNKYADLIKECGGLDLLEKIQANDNIDNEIYAKIYALLNRYWGHDGNNDNNNDKPNMNINNLNQ